MFGGFSLALRANKQTAYSAKKNVIASNLSPIPTNSAPSTSAWLRHHGHGLGGECAVHLQRELARLQLDDHVDRPVLRGQGRQRGPHHALGSGLEGGAGPAVGHQQVSSRGTHLILSGVAIRALAFFGKMQASQCDLTKSDVILIASCAQFKHWQRENSRKLDRSSDTGSKENPT